VLVNFVADNKWELRPGKLSEQGFCFVAPASLDSYFWPVPFGMYLVFSFQLPYNFSVGCLSNCWIQLPYFQIIVSTDAKFDAS
jgi:hypothetical protein